MTRVIALSTVLVLAGLLVDMIPTSVVLIGVFLVTIWFYKVVWKEVLQYPWKCAKCKYGLHLDEKDLDECPICGTIIPH